MALFGLGNMLECLYLVHFVIEVQIFQFALVEKVAEQVAERDHVISTTWRLEL